MIRQNSVNTIECIEAITLCNSLPDHSVDAVITDPPYGTTDLSFDKGKLDMDWVTALLRVVKPNGYLACFAPVAMQAEIAGVWSVRFTGAWVKQTGGMRTAAAKKPMNQWELYSVFAHPNHKVAKLTWNKVFVPGESYRKVQRFTGYIRDGKNQIDRSNTSGWTKDGYISNNLGSREVTDVLRGNSKPGMTYDERTIHPTQKPLSVIEVLIRWLTNPGDLILDPFCGSGTTAVAALRTGRDYICGDTNAEYVEIANNRIRTVNPFIDTPLSTGAVQRSLFSEVEA